MSPARRGQVVRNAPIQRPRYAPAFARAADPAPPLAIAPEAVEIAEAARLMSISASEVQYARS